MAKTRGVEAKLSRLRALRQESATPELVAELARALEDAANLVVAAAAEIVGDRALAELAPQLVAAFDRFMIEPHQDKICRAKTAIVEALNKIDSSHEEVFLRGIRHVENSLDGQDAGAHLRGNCALGLVRMRHGEALALVVDLLLDRAKVARIAAVQALGASGATAAMPLLRFKARIGDPDPTVTAECLTALMSLDAAKSLPFVTEFLRSGAEALQEGAILALAESRRPEVLGILKDFWPRARRGQLEEVVLLAIAMLRVPAALDFLLDVLADKNQSTAQAALAALAIHRHNEKLRERIAAELARKGDAALLARFKEKFAQGSASNKTI